MSRTRITLALALSGAAIIAACSSDDGPTTPPGPTPGNLTVSLTTPNAGDKSIHIRITGAGATDSIKSVAASGSYSIQSRIENGNVSQVAVFGDLTAGALVTIAVPDVGAANRYAATVVDAADAANATRSSLTGYSLAVQ